MGQPTLHFRGIPTSLDSLVPLGRDAVASAPRISIESLSAAPTPLTVTVFDGGDRVTRLHTSLSRSTPPGTYRGTAELAGTRYPIEVHIDPAPHLSLSPRQTILSASPHSVVNVDLMLGNSGNVPCLIGRTHAFGLYDVQGAERAIGSSLRHTGNANENRTERLLKELAAGHGGLVRVEVREGAGPIAPGDVKPLRLSLHLPDGLKAGHTYSGTLPLENLRYYFKIAVTAEGQ